MKEYQLVVVKVSWDELMRTVCLLGVNSSFVLRVGRERHGERWGWFLKVGPWWVVNSGE